MDERRFTAVPQDSIHHTHRGAPGEALDVDGPAAVKIRVGSSLEQQPEALEVVVGSADVQRADHQRGERPQTEAGDPGSEVVIHVHICTVPGCGKEKSGGSETRATAAQLQPMVTKWQGMSLKDTRRVSTLPVFGTSVAHHPRTAHTYPQMGLEGLLSRHALSSTVSSSRREAVSLPTAARALKRGGAAEEHLSLPS